MLAKSLSARFPRKDAVFVGALLLVSFVESSIHFGRISSDSPDYVNVAYWLEGKAPLAYPFRLIRILVPFLAAAIDSHTSIGIVTSFAIINCCLWYASSVITFYFWKRFLGFDNKSAFVASLLVVTSYFYLVYGSAVMTDMGLYFFLISGLFAWMLFCRAEKHVEVKFLCALLVSNLALLTRETAIFLPVFAIVFAVLNKKWYKASLMFVLGSFALPSAWFVASGALKYYVDWYFAAHYLVGTSASQGSTLSTLLSVPSSYLRAYPRSTLASLLQAFSLSLPFSILGFLEDDTPSNLRFYIAEILAAAIVFSLTFPMPDPRNAFIAFAAVAPLASRGINWFAMRLSQKEYFHAIPASAYLWLIVLTYILVENFVTRAPAVYNLLQP